MLVSGCQQQNLENFTAEQFERDTREFSEPSHKYLKLKDAVREVHGVGDVALISLPNDVYVGVEVPQMQRLRLKQIRAEVHQQIKKHYPEDKVHVSTDWKIYRELKKLDTQQQELSDKKMKEKVKALEEKMRG